MNGDRIHLFEGFTLDFGARLPGLQEREVQITFMKIDTRWDDFRADPRFQEIMRQVGLPQ